MIKTYAAFYTYLFEKANIDMRSTKDKDYLIRSYVILVKKIKVLRDFQLYELPRLPSKSMISYFHKVCKEYEEYSKVVIKDIYYYNALLSWYNIVLDKVHDFDIYDYVNNVDKLMQGR